MEREMFETVKDLPFVEQIIGDENGFIIKVRDTDFYYSWDSGETIGQWDEGGHIEKSGELVEFEYVFDSCPEPIREQLVYHLELFTHNHD